LTDSSVESVIKSSDQFEDTPQGWQRRWQTEISASRDAQKKFHEDGRKVVRAFRAEREDGDLGSLLPLFTANVQTLQALLYGKVPKVDVKRRWGDPDDVFGRTASEMIQRLLNTDIERDSDTYVGALLYVLNDRLLPGFGLARVRYVADFETEEVPAVMKESVEIEPAGATEKKTHEDVAVDYIHWDDVLWSAGSKIFEEWRWAAFRCPMTQDELAKRFASKLHEDGATGEKLARELPLNSRENRRDTKQLAGEDPWQRADVWEIWDKESRKVWWVIEGYSVVLDSIDDPYELEGFWPFPRPLAANLTTDAYSPRADYILAQDLYTEVNTLSGRIALLEKAIRVAGLYNGTSEAVQRLLSEAGMNELIPVPEWREFAESGGVEGNIAWFPLEQVTKAIEILEKQRQSKISLLYQVTGMSDIMRGESSGPTTATEQAIKAKFASVRTTHFQEDFAKFASDLQRLRAELIMNLFDDETLISRSNIMFTNDRENVQGALQLLRDEFVAYRIEVKPESVSATDYAAMQQERVALIQTVSQFLQSMGPIAQMAPEMVPYMLDMLKWMFVGFRGSNTIEQSLDQAVVQSKKMIAQMQQQKAMAAQNPPPPDPKVVAAQVKGKVDMQKAQLDAKQAQFDHQARTQEVAQDAQAHHATLAMDMQANVLDHQLGIQKMEHEMQRDAVRAATEVTHNGTKGDK
jgi:hypothetical protein